MTRGSWMGIMAGQENWCGLKVESDGGTLCLTNPLTKLEKMISTL